MIDARAVSTAVAPLRVASGFEKEFPGADASASEAAINLVRTCSVFLGQMDRRRRSAADLSGAAAEALAILEDQPLPPHVISERMLLTSGSMTSLLDTLEKRGLVRRRTHPDDRRKLLVEVTEAGRSVLDQMLPRVHAFCNEVFSVLSAPEREQLINLLARVRGRLASTQRAPISPGKSRRKKR